MTGFNKEILYRIGITLLPKVGDINGKKLISYCGGAEAVFREKGKNLMKIPGIGRAIVSAIKGNDILERAEEEIKFLEKYHLKPLYYLGKTYPERLKHCIDAPIMLYYKGNTDLNSSKVISVVGTRTPTRYGKEVCQRIISELGQYKVLVVSGLAYGIDTQAHKSALKSGLDTLAVLGHGLDRIYPWVNRQLAKRMVGQGGLLTEFISGTNPDFMNFPRRNRIVAGISDAVLVIESAEKGGALITADIANSYSRDVFAVPGNLDMKYSGGCNFLIKTNRAALIQSAQDVVFMMGWDDAPIKQRKQRRMFIELSGDEEKLIGFLRNNNEIGIDRLCLESGISPSKAVSALLNLEFEGIVKCLPGNVYKLLE